MESKGVLRCLIEKKITCIFFAVFCCFFHFFLHKIQDIWGPNFFFKQVPSLWTGIKYKSTFCFSTDAFAVQKEKKRKETASSGTQEAFYFLDSYLSYYIKDLNPVQATKNA